MASAMEKRPRSWNLRGDDWRAFSDMDMVSMVAVDVKRHSHGTVGFYCWVDVVDFIVDKNVG